MTTERKIVSIVNNLSIEVAQAEERFQILMDSEVTDLDIFNESSKVLINRLTIAELVLNKFKSILEKSNAETAKANEKAQELVPVEAPQELVADKK